MDHFSEELTALAAPHAAWAAERVSRCNELLDGRELTRRIAEGRVYVDEREVPAGFLSSCAEDHTLKWGWSFDDPPGLPANRHAERLREIGERHAVPELTATLVELDGFPDPRYAAERLAVLALGLLGAGGLVRHGSGGRARNILVIDDPGLPAHSPDLVRVGAWLRAGARLLGADAGHATALVRGYAEHHGLPHRDRADGVEFDLPGGERVRAHIEDGDRLGTVTVSGSDGPVPATDLAPGTDRASELEADQPLPVALLERAAPVVAATLDATERFDRWLRGRDWDGQITWDPRTGRLRLGDLVDLRAHEIGRLDTQRHRWQWADVDGPGARWFRDLARNLGAPHLADDVVDLGDRPRWEWVAGLLAHGAVPVSGTWCQWGIPQSWGRIEGAVTTPEMPTPDTEGSTFCARRSSAPPTSSTRSPRGCTGTR